MSQAGSSEVYRFRLNYKSPEQMDAALKKTAATKTMLVPTKREVPGGAKVRISLNVKGLPAEKEVALEGFCHAPSRSGYVCRIMKMPGGTAEPASRPAPRPAPSRSTETSSPAPTRAARPGRSTRRKLTAGDLKTFLRRYRGGFAFAIAGLAVIIAVFTLQPEATEQELQYPRAWHATVQDSGVLVYKDLNLNGQAPSSF